MIRKILTEKKLYGLSFCALFVPILVIFFLLYQKEQELIDKAYKIQSIQQKATTSYLQRAEIDRFLKKHQDADDSYVENNLESYTFLQNEIESLQSLLAHPAFQNSQTASRYEEITSSNQLQFVEDQPKTNKICKEANLHQKKPIEIDNQDFIHLLELIEEDQPNKPQLIIKSLDWKKTENQTIFLKMDLLKRKFNQ